ncbi:MAG: 5-formyltetrahydrofolate cyclo-ligase [Planctomycetes bacterium]|nr:5-formyltetrahydrofolate cyclo-ligase [Planctomycetota bacterium]
MNDPALHAAKQALRARVRAARRAQPPALRAAETDATIAATTAFLTRGDAHVVASYMALPDELDLAALHRHLWNTGRPLLLPRVVGPGLLAWHVVTGPDGLVPGAYGIREPDPHHAPATELPDTAIVLVPGVAFARDGRRLGQGGGFYDRALAGRSVRAIGIGFTCQLVEDLPHGAHDRMMDALIIAGTMPLE